MQHLALVSAVVLALCVAVAHGQTTMTLPPLTPAYNIPPAEQIPCGPLTTSFQTKWDSPVTPAACAAVETETWNTYKVGAAPAGGWTFTTFLATTSKAACDTAADLLTAADAPKGRAMCNFVQDVVDACACKKLECITVEVNKEVTAANAQVCNPFAQKACQHFRARIPDACAAAFLATISPADFTWTSGSLSQTCPTAVCPAATQSTTAPPGTTPSGAVSGVSVTTGLYVAASAVALGASIL